MKKQRNGVYYLKPSLFAIIEKMLSNDKICILLVKFIFMSLSHIFLVLLLFFLFVLFKCLI